MTKISDFQQVLNFRKQGTENYDRSGHIIHRKS